MSKVSRVKVRAWATKPLALLDLDQEATFSGGAICESAAVHRLALAFGRIRARDVESPVLHEVEIGGPTAGLSTARKALAAVRDQLGVFDI